MIPPLKFQSNSSALVYSVGTRIWLLACPSPLFASSSVWSQPPFAQAKQESKTEVTLDVLEPIHLEAAKEYAIYLDRGHREELVLRKTPVSQWVNPRRAGGQLGHVFVWMNGETPAAMAAIFSFPWRGVMTDRRIVHELHALDPSRLFVTRQNREAKWRPKSGLERKPIVKIRESANTLARFKISVRTIARRFSGHCIDSEGQRWELRVLPTPLLIYPIDKSPNMHGFGAIVGMMGDAGNDLESGLLLEAVTESGRSNDAAAQWFYAPIRMTDMETFLQFDRQPIWKSVRTETDTNFHDTPHVYFRFQDKTVPLQDSQR